MRYIIINAGKCSHDGILLSYLTYELLENLDRKLVAKNIYDEYTAKYLDETLKLFDGTLVAGESCIGYASVELLKYLIRQKHVQLTDIDMKNVLFSANVEKVKVALEGYTKPLDWVYIFDLIKMNSIDSEIVINYLLNEHRAIFDLYSYKYGGGWAYGPRAYGRQLACIISSYNYSMDTIYNLVDIIYPQGSPYIVEYIDGFEAAISAAKEKGNMKLASYIASRR